MGCFGNHHAGQRWCLLLRYSIVYCLHGEEEVPVSVDMDGEDWDDANFMSHLVDGDEDGGEEVDDDEAGDDEAGDDDIEVNEELVHKYRQFTHTVRDLDKIKLFLEDQGYCQETDAVSSALDMVASVHIASLKQTTLHNYLVAQPSTRDFNCS